MNDTVWKQLWSLGAVVLAAAVLVATLWGGRMALGVLAGGAWNLVNLWCLTRLLSSWLGPRRSTKRGIMWLAVKFPLLYLLAFSLLQHPAVSIVGFSVGFSVVLMTAVAFLALRARSMFAPAQER